MDVAIIIKYLNAAPLNKTEAINDIGAIKISTGFEAYARLNRNPPIIIRMSGKNMIKPINATINPCGLAVETHRAR